MSGRAFIIVAPGQAEGPVPTFASAGLEHRAAAISGIAGSAWDYLADLLGHRPEVQVLVLSEADWPEKGRAPLFALPNAEAGTLVVAGTEAGWWSELAPMARADGQAELLTVYGGPDGNLHERRVAEVVLVVEQVDVGLLQVLVLALVLPGEEVALPDVGEPVSPTRLDDPLL